MGVPQNWDESFKVLEDSDEDVEDIVEECVQVMGITSRVLFCDDDEDEAISLTEEAQVQEETYVQY